MLPAPLRLPSLLWQVRGAGGGSGCGGTPIPAQSGGVPGTGAAAVHQWKNCHPLWTLQHCPHAPPPFFQVFGEEVHMYIWLQYHFVPFRFHQLWIPPLDCRVR